VRADKFFDDGEHEVLKQTFAATTATSDLLARQKIRERWLKVVNRKHSEPRKFADPATPPLMQPTKALDYFRKLTPTIGVDPLRWGAAMERHAFTLSVDTEGVVLDKVQKLIADRLATGVGISTAPSEIDAILNEAGIAPANPQYAEMVFRTNQRDAYVTAADEERRDPDVVDFFPAWRYSAIVDSRSRPEHSARNGNYYPADLTFTEVRGTEAGDVCNCRCDFIALDKFEWADLEAKGARFAI
jgi:SPP1 gp7 family putative phage head morphogenesis protein